MVTFVLWGQNKPKTVAFGWLTIRSAGLPWPLLSLDEPRTAHRCEACRSGMCCEWGAYPQHGQPLDGDLPQLPACRAVRSGRLGCMSCAAVISFDTRTAYCRSLEYFPAGKKKLLLAPLKCLAQVHI